MSYQRMNRSAAGSATFSNYRDWRAFLSAMQAPAAYASVATALKAGHDWLTGHQSIADSGTETCDWRLGESGLAPGKTLGV
jgi:hypothetical protein